jgi:predicted metal-dependent phosphoesterase TrpH
MSRDQNAGRSHSVRIDNSSIERVEEFKYLGTTLTIICRLAKQSLIFWDTYEMKTAVWLSSRSFSETHTQWRLPFGQAVAHFLRHIRNEDCRLAKQSLIFWDTYEMKTAVWPSSRSFSETHTKWRLPFGQAVAQFLRHIRNEDCRLAKQSLSFWDTSEIYLLDKFRDRE